MFITCSLDWLLDCSHLREGYWGNAPTNLCVSVLVWASFCFSWAPGRGIAGSCCGSSGSLAFWRKVRLVPLVAVSSHSLSSKAWLLQFPAPADPWDYLVQFSHGLDVGQKLAAFSGWLWHQLSLFFSRFSLFLSSSRRCLFKLHIHAKIGSCFIDSSRVPCQTPDLQAVSFICEFFHIS